ncbi:transport and golgi organization 14 [Lycorma delicatula]|uniref:transport and golgi organization 14 n=1 Tax=Lycorma delicatula TaxID=130591 RepID=UPI003F516633
MDFKWRSALSFPAFLLLNVIHGFYSLYLFLYSIYCEFLRRTQVLYYEIILSSKNTHTYGFDNTKFFQKIPKHLAIIIGSERIFYTDLVKLICWCSQLGIKFISFYHQNNNINANLLYEAFHKCNKENSRKVVWNKSFEEIKKHIKLDLNGHKKCDASEQIHVNIFRTNDGMNYLIEASKELCKTNHNSSSVTLNLLEDVLQAKIKTTDPDLAIIFGDTCSSFGFLPWHVRVTEFLHFHSHHNITSRDFISLLEKYNKCEQRFGK